MSTPKTILSLSKMTAIYSQEESCCWEKVHKSWCSLLHSFLNLQVPITDMTKLKPLFLKKVDSAKQEDHNSDNAAFAKRDNTVSRFQSESQNQNSFLDFSGFTQSFEEFVIILLLLIKTANFRNLQFLNSYQNLFSFVTIFSKSFL